MAHIVRPLRFKNMILEDYGVDSETGDIWSFKYPKHPKIMTASPRNPNQPKTNYPCVGLTDPQFKKRSNGQSVNVINVHLLVAHTLLEIPIPEGVTEKEWKRTPMSMKTACLGIYQVNHIDHDKFNYRPDNLNYKTPSDNSQEAIKHYQEVTGQSGFNFGDLGEKSRTENGKHVNRIPHVDGGKMVIETNGVKINKPKVKANLNKFFK